MFESKWKEPVLIAGIQWLLTTVFEIDRLFFTYNHRTGYFYVTKILYFVILLAAWSFGFNSYKKIKEGNKEYCRGLEIFTVYLILMMILLLILWPGTWSWDDLWVLNGISSYNSWYPWQNIITGAYLDVLLQILPFPGGIVLLQNVIISLCVAFGVTRLEMIFKIKRLKYKFADIFIKIFPFLLSPVLLYQFSGYRMGLYVYLEFTVLVILIGAFKDKTEWSGSYLCLFCFLCIIVSVWRTESFLYMPVACLAILFVKKNIIPKKRKILCIILLIIGFFGISRVQNVVLENSNYEVISLLGPCVALVRAADSVEDADLLADIDNIAKVEVIYNNPALNGNGLYWSTDIIREGYTDGDYNVFLQAIVKLSFKYPKVVLNERWDMFVKSSGITGAEFTVKNAAALYEPDNGSSIAEIILNKGYIANKPIFSGIRKQFINFLGMKKMDGSGIYALHWIVYNAMIPILVLVYAWIKLFIRKKWYWLGICTAVLCKLPIIILTEPDSWFMYFLSFYLLGYIYLVYSVIIFLPYFNKFKWLKKLYA